MTSATLQSDAPTPTAPSLFLPPKMKVLFITGRARTGQWLAEAFASDGASQVLLDDVQGVTAGLKRLRDEVYDAVLISHEPGDMDALDFLEVLRTGSSEEQPIVVLGAQSEQQLAALCYEVGADAYINVHATTTRTLLWQVARAVQRHKVLQENRALRHAQKQQQQREQDEANKLLQQQRDLFQRLTGEGNFDAREPLPPRLVQHYRSLLKAYIIMGSGNLYAEMQQLVELLVLAGATAQETMRLHVLALEEIIQGLGNRSARHVMNRADLLALEVVTMLAEEYRQNYLAAVDPPQQQLLPGFDPLDVARVA